LQRIALWAIPALRRAPYGLVAALVLVRFADEWAAFLPAGALEPVRGELGITYAQAAGVLVALPAGGLLGNVFVVAADHVSRRWLASFGALAYGLALIAFGLGHTLATLLIAAFLWGAASDAFVHGCEVALVDLAGEALPTALARMNGWAALGDLAGPLTLAACAAVGLSWRAAFFGVGAAMLGYAIWIASQRLPPPRPPSLRPPPASAIWATLRDLRVAILALVLGLFGLLDEPLDGFLIAELERVRHLGAALAALPVLAILLGGLAGFAGYERLAGARSTGNVLLASALAMTGALAATVFAPWLAMQLAAGFGFGLTGAVFYTTLDAILLALRPGQAGATSAVVSTIGLLGVGFPAVVGALADRAGLAAGLALYALIPAVIVIILALNRRSLSRRS